MELRWKIGIGTILTFIAMNVAWLMYTNDLRGKNKTLDSEKSTLSTALENCELALLQKVVGPPTKADSTSPFYGSLVVQGPDLSDDEVNELEALLVADPHNLPVRTKLLAYYTGKESLSSSERGSWLKHITWVIQNSPDARVAGSPMCMIYPMFYPEGYQKLAHLWLKQVAAHEENPAVLANAANFFTFHDNQMAESLLVRAHVLDPDNPGWSRRLGQLYTTMMIRAPSAEREDLAKRSLTHLERALDKTSFENRFYLFSYLAKISFEAGDWKKAKNYADLLLSHATKHQNDWNYGNAIHIGNLVLGRLALRRGDTQEAIARLIEAGKTPGSPQLNSFGPSAALAKELLEEGETNAVVEYFELCQHFWEDGKDRLQQWISVVKEGRIPDFGANLWY
jgi:hypothetical protein